MGEYIPETANAWSRGYIHLENTRYNKIFLSLSRFFVSQFVFCFFVILQILGDVFPFRSNSLFCDKL